MSVIHAPKKPIVDSRVLILPAAMLLMLLVLFLRLWYVQVVKAPELQEKAAATRTSKTSKLAPRGLIYDRNGVLIAGVRPEIVVTAKPALIRKHPESLERLAAILNVEVERLEGKIRDSSFRPYLPTVVYTGLDIKTGTKIAELADELPGIEVDTQPMRFYPDNYSFTHVLGRVGVPAEEDVKRIEGLGGRPAQFVGKSGLERAYEMPLMGMPGSETVELDVKRRPLRVVGRDSAIPGTQLESTLDARLQKLATSLLGKHGYRGAVVAIDPRNGELLCLVSSPTFDQNMFAGGISSAEWAHLNNHPGKPMINRATYASYSPGSTFKIVTALAAVQSGRFDPRATVTCAGGYRIGSSLRRCMGRHGAISFSRAMQVSCNTYFFTVGMQVGPEALRKASFDSGLGEVTGLEILGESKGVVPTEEWIKRWRNPPRWYGGDTLNLSIGQGELRATPLQMANVAALVANNGVNYRPHLVRAMRSPLDDLVKPVEPEVLHQVDAPPQFWNEMKASLIAVLEGGTAGSARIPGVVWGGKTGSTEHRKGEKTHGWFVGFAPANDPKIAVAVLVEAAGHGGEVAAPIAREVVKRYLVDESSASSIAATAPTSSRSNSAAARRPASSSRRR
jgi:penicillin-binding protein 2